MFYSPVTKTCKHFGIQQCSETNSYWICFLGGTEDDLIRSKHVALTSILFYGI